LEEDVPGVRGKEMDRPKLGAISMDLGVFFLLLLDAYGEMVWEEMRRSWYICFEELDRRQGSLATGGCTCG
jgi:hypothetical protein